MRRTAWLLALTMSLACSVKKGSPYDPVEPTRTVMVDGLHAQVDIVRDDYGIPHVYATNLEDLGFGFGYVEATDRLVQMDLFRHVASGTVAELFGGLDASQIDADLSMRTHMMRPLAEQTWAQLEASTDPDDQKMVIFAVGFAAGVNRFMDELRAGDAAIDQAAADWFNIDTAQPWTPVDSLTIGRLQTWALSFGAGDEIRLTRALQAAQKAFSGADPRAGVWFDLLQSRPMDLTSTIDGYPNHPTDTGTRAKRAAGAGATRPWLDTRVLDDALTSLGDPHVLGMNLRPDGMGSNNWIVGPPIAGAGTTMLANDTHLQLSNPSIFYMVHLTMPGEVDVEGVSFPGIPVLLLGHNEHIAWGATVVYHDITDVYAEEIAPCSSGTGDCVIFGGNEVQIETRTETIKVGVKGIISNSFEVSYEIVPHHGPILPTIADHNIVPRVDAQALSVRFPGYEPTMDVRAFFKMNRAKNVEEAFAALEDFTHGGQNWVIIDDQGGYGWTTIESVPWRSPACFAFGTGDPAGLSPYLVLPGDGSCEWEDIMDSRYIPHAVNPDKGYIATANADPVGETFDGDALNGPVVDGNHQLYLNAYYDPGYRVGRITRLIEEVKASGQPMTLEKMGEIQADTRSNMGERMLPHVVAALDALEGEMTTPGTHPDLADWAGGLSQAQLARIGAASERLRAWTLATPAAIGQATPDEITDSVATTIFNAMMVRLVANTIGDELAAIGEVPESHVSPRAVLALYERPGELETGIAKETGEGLLCDRLDTGEVESCTLLLLVSLDEALEWAENEGFATAELDAWRWGLVHTLTLASLLPTPELDVPPSDDPNPDLRGGYPRHGDQYSVDSGDNGYEDFDMRYGHGPAIRHLTEFTAPGQPRTLFALPGGEIHDRSSSHYRDLMDNYWSVNQYFELPFTITQIIDTAEERWKLLPSQ